MNGISPHYLTSRALSQSFDNSHCPIQTDYKSKSPEPVEGRLALLKNQRNIPYQRLSFAIAVRYLH